MAKIGLVPLLAVSLLLSSCSADPKEGLVAACEAVLKDTLKSPSGYKRISLTIDEKKATSEEYFAHTNPKSKGNSPSATEITQIMKEEIDAGRMLMTYSKIIIEYDSPNSFGTLIRDKALCTHVGRTLPRGVQDRKEVKINGKSDFDRLMESADRLSTIGN